MSGLPFPKRWELAWLAVRLKAVGIMPIRQSDYDYADGCQASTVRLFQALGSVLSAGVDVGQRMRGRPRTSGEWTNAVSTEKVVGPGGLEERLQIARVHIAFGCAQKGDGEQAARSHKTGDGEFLCRAAHHDVNLAAHLDVGDGAVTVLQDDLIGARQLP